MVRLNFTKQIAIFVHASVHTSDIEILCVRGGCFEVKRLGGSDFRNDPQKKRQHARSNSWPAISFSPFFLILRPRQIVEELSFTKIGNISHKFRSMVEQSHSRHLRNELTGRSTKSADGQINRTKGFIERQRVSLQHGSLEHRLGNFKPDEVVVTV